MTSTDPPETSGSGGGLLLAAVGLMLAAAPWPTATPHLVEKLTMLSQEALSAPLDIFDLLMHGAGIPIAAVALWRWARRSPAAPGE